MTGRWKQLDASFQYCVAIFNDGGNLRLRVFRVMLFVCNRKVPAMFSKAMEGCIAHCARRWDCTPTSESFMRIYGSRYVLRKNVERTKNIESQRSLLHHLAQEQDEKQSTAPSKIEHSKDMVEKKFPFVLFSLADRATDPIDSLDSIHTKQRLKCRTEAISSRAKAI